MSAWGLLMSTGVHMSVTGVCQEPLSATYPTGKLGQHDWGIEVVGVADKAELLRVRRRLLELMGYRTWREMVEAEYRLAHPAPYRRRA